MAAGRRERSNLLVFSPSAAVAVRRLPGRGSPRERSLARSVRKGEMQTQLFNVEKDRRQSIDRATDYPEVVERLKLRAVQFLESIEAPPEQLGRLGLAVPQT
jgi:hypothetical protein